MTTTREAIERITEATGLPPATVTYAARFLAEADTALWPKGGRGGGKNAAHVDVRHLTNLVLALYGGEQVKDAAATVAAFSDLILLRDVKTRTVEEAAPSMGFGVFDTPALLKVYPAEVSEIDPDGMIKEMPGLLSDGSVPTTRHEMADCRDATAMLWTIGTVNIPALKSVTIRRDTPEIEIVFAVERAVDLVDGGQETITTRHTYTYGRHGAEESAPIGRAKITSELPPALFSVIAGLHRGFVALNDGGDLFPADNVNQPGAAGETTPQTEKDRSVGADRSESDNTDRNSLATNVPLSTEQGNARERGNQPESDSESEIDSRSPVPAVGGRRFVTESPPTIRRPNDGRSYRPDPVAARTG